MRKWLETIRTFFCQFIFHISLSHLHCMYDFIYSLYKYVQVFSVISKLPIYLKGKAMTLLSYFPVPLLPFKLPSSLADSLDQSSMPNSFDLPFFQHSLETAPTKATHHQWFFSQSGSTEFLRLSLYKNHRILVLDTTLSLCFWLQKP